VVIGPQFEYRLAWCERLIDQAAGWRWAERWFWRGLDVVPTDFDICNFRRTVVAAALERRHR
jgi:hypothetical protein